MKIEMPNQSCSGSCTANATKLIWHFLPGRLATTAPTSYSILRPSQGVFTEPKSVNLRILAPEAGIEVTTYQAQPVAPGHYRVTGLPLCVAGSWQLRVRVLVDDFTNLHLETTVTLRQ